MNIESKQGKYALEIPLDTSGIEGFEPEQKVKVLVVHKDGRTNSVSVEFDQKGKGKAVFTFGEKPGALRVIIGPDNATDEELQGLQTIGLNVSTRRWTNVHKLELPIKIAPYYWWWWLRWCRKFTIRGRVLCPDGRPVPGAKVCAYDVDAWWWWSSRQLVGCGATDATGAFEISFRWCCGWWPWWWWKSRVWQLEPYLIERIRPLLEREPQLQRIPLPDPTPDLRIFEELLGPDEFAGLRILPTVSAMHEDLAGTLREPECAAGMITASAPAQLAIDPKIMPRLRERIVAKLPIATELEALRIWPWWPGHPWWDCTPDIIFRVTQDCQQPNTIIVDEGYGDARWNIATNLDVTLTANDKACCIADGDDDPQGLCALITDVCHRSPINFIGGNPGAAADPVGYYRPGVIADDGDRPFGGHVLVQGQVGNDVDYYEFQYSDDGVIWNAMPNQAVGDIPRQYWIPATNTFQLVPFLHTVDGRLVFESRQHFEATHDPATWGINRFWMAHNYFSLMNWITETPFRNGTYRLRIVGWSLVGGHLVNPQPQQVHLPICSTQTPAELILRIDNRLIGAASGHPIGDPNHPCGAGSVHTCTLEPDTDFLHVRIVHADGSPASPVGACGNVPIGLNDILEVEFFAHDPEGHLAYFTLQATYGENLAVNLLGVPSFSLPGFGLLPLAGAPVPPATQVGPTYTAARLAGAAAPVWHGGAMRLRVKAAEAFPRTCCYQLELRAHKRTIVGCDYSLWNHINYSEVSFMVVV